MDAPRTRFQRFTGQGSAALILLAIWMVGVAEGQEVNLEGVPVTLGEPREDVLARLQERLLVLPESPAPGEDFFGVLRPFPGGGGVGVGTVRFSGGRLTEVSRDWRLGDDQDPHSVLQVVVRVLRELGASSSAPCSVEESSVVEPTRNWELVIIVCGGRRVSIMAGTEGPEEDRVRGISEMWILDR